jgi:hypothetical protein
MRLGFLIAPTAADIRDTLVEGPSGLLAVAPPWCLPRFEPSKRRVTWPNGARAICLSGEEPERCRGANVDTIWADELACWQRARQTWDLSQFALRAGACPQALVTTTPRRSDVLKRILEAPTTVMTTESTYANKSNLAPEFVEQIVAAYEGSRLGRQEIHAEILSSVEGQWFGSWDPAKHVTVQAEYQYGLPVRCSIDAGTSRHTAAMFFQVMPVESGRSRVRVFGDYHAKDVVSSVNAVAIRERCMALCGRAPDLVRIDPASTARTSIGPASYGEYERVFGRTLARWPMHRVLDGLDQMEILLDTGNLLVHPRCSHLREAFNAYRKIERAGNFIDQPADDHPHEDAMDALRGGIRDAFPEGRPVQSNLRTIPAGRIT